MVRVDELGLRFNYVQDLGAAANGGNGNRYRYQIVLPWMNVITSGAGGAAGLGSDVNLGFDKAQFSISFIWHKMAMELLVPDSGSLNPEIPFAHRDFGGKWQFVMDNLGADVNGIAINNKRRNKGQFIADFQLLRPPAAHGVRGSDLPHARTAGGDDGVPAEPEPRLSAPGLQLRAADLPAAGRRWWCVCLWLADQQRSCAGADDHVHHAGRAGPVR